jgi:hypothetical protein
MEYWNDGMKETDSVSQMLQRSNKTKKFLPLERLRHDA